MKHRTALVSRSAVPPLTTQLGSRCCHRCCWCRCCSPAGLATRPTSCIHRQRQLDPPAGPFSAHPLPVFHTQHPIFRPFMIDCRACAPCLPGSPTGAPPTCTHAVQSQRAPTLFLPPHCITSLGPAGFRHPMPLVPLRPPAKPHLPSQHSKLLYPFLGPALSGTAYHVMRVHQNRQGEGSGHALNGSGDASGGFRGFRGALRAIT